MFMSSFYSARQVHCLLAVALVASSTIVANAQAADVAAARSTFTGLSVYTATGYQHTMVKVTDIRVQGTDIRLPSERTSTNGSFWFTGLDYTRVFANQFSLGAQVEYYPRSGQLTLSVAPGYAFNDRWLGYVKFGWAYVPTTFDQGPGLPRIKEDLNAVFAGVGAKRMIYGGLFGYAELRYAQVERFNFNSAIGVIPIQGRVDVTAVNAIIGLGYRF
jgi:opacity protein-like surface antigen